MKIFYAYEFLENGETIRLISIGMIREDGKPYYAVVDNVSVMYDAFQHPWLAKNVMPSLPVEIDDRGIVSGNGTHPDVIHLKDRKTIAEDVKRFVLDTPNPELWAYSAAYDHVALCQLYGRMIDLPTGFPMYTNDLKSLIMQSGNPQVPEQSEGHHNALADATWNKDTYEYLQGLQRAKELILDRD